MSDKDFDKIFGDKLREERSFSSVDKDWEQMSSNLDVNSQTKENNKRRRGAAWLWLLLLPFLSFFLWQMNDLKNQNKQLAQQLTEMQLQFNAYKLEHVTPLQQVTKTDTVIIYKYLPAEKKSNDLISNKKSPPPPRPSVNNDFSNNLTPILEKNNAFSAAQKVENQDIIIPKTLTDDRKMAELLKKLSALETQMSDLKQALSDSKANAANLADCATKQDSLAKQLIATRALVDSLSKHPLSIEPQKTDKTLKNNRLYIGLQGGNIRYKTTWKNSIGIDVYKNIESYQAGLKLEYALTEKLRLTAEGNFCPVSFTNYWYDSRYNLPALQYDYQKEKFLKAESKQSLLQGNIGVKYFFTEGSAKWRPFVSAAYTLMRIKPFETKFTYQPLWGTTYREQTVASNAVNVPNLVLLSGGLEYRFSKYWVAQTEVFYYKDINKTHKTFDLFGLRAAVLLNLK